jgi:hypothetical protein
MATYIHDNTDDEFTHQNFMNVYLVSKGADPVHLEKFRTLKGSSATGSSGILSPALPFFRLPKKLEETRINNSDLQFRYRVD